MNQRRTDLVNRKRENSKKEINHDELKVKKFKTKRREKYGVKNQRNLQLPDSMYPEFDDFELDWQ